MSEQTEIEQLRVEVAALRSLVIALSLRIPDADRRQFIDDALNNLRPSEHFEGPEFEAASALTFEIEKAWQ